MKGTHLIDRPATAVAGFFLAAVLGALLSPLLSGALGPSGMAYIALAMPAYHFLTMAGALVFPVIIGRMLALLLESGETDKARTLFADSLLALVLPGAALGVITALLAAPIAALCHLSGGAVALVGIAPYYLLSMAAAALRGYILGTGHYGYYALSLLIQQVGKVLFASLLAGLGKGNPAAMAQWACFGISMAEALSLLVLGVLFAFSVQGSGKREGQSGGTPIGGLARKLWTTGGLVALLASLPALLSIVDALVIPGRFDAVLTNPSVAAGGYALLSAFSLPVVLFPGAMCAFIALLGLNSAAARAENRAAELSGRVALSTKGAFLLSVPAAVTMGILAKPLLMLLFSSALSGAQLDTAVDLVRLLAAGTVFSALGITSAMQLCSMGYTAVGIVNAVAALLIKLIVTLLLATAERTVFGGAFATVVALFAFCAFNMVQALRRARARFDLVNALVKPVICAFCMGTAMYFLHFALLEKLMGAAGCILSALGGYLIYIALGVATRVLTREDYERLPFGRNVYEILSGIGMVK
jgi:stage V sporulation protein B